MASVKFKPGESGNLAVGRRMKNQTRLAYLLGIFIF